jgi:nucleotide-binding universal stress UspA family protein
MSGQAPGAHDGRRRALSRHPLLLVPTDGSKLSRCALPLAIELAIRLDGRLQLLAVLDDSLRKPMSEFAAGEGISLSEAITAMLQRTEHDAVGDTPIDAQSDYVINDNAAEAILEFADAQGAGMIVLSSHGRSGPGRWLLGSVAHKIVQAASVPVVIVPARDIECGGVG